MTRAAVSPLALVLEFQVPETGMDLRELDTLLSPVIRMKGGETIEQRDCVMALPPIPVMWK